MINHYADTQTTSINRDMLHAIIKHFKEAFPDNFKKCGMKICTKCDGSGIPVQKSKHTDITFWQPGNYCDKCKGFGVIGIKRIYDEYMCKKCNGDGCSDCNDRGSVDWISNAVKG